MPQSDNNQTGASTKQANHSIENRATQLEDTHRVSQDARLREQSFQATEALNPDRSQDKRKRREMSL
jgi:hypothetical protein